MSTPVDNVIPIESRNPSADASAQGGVDSNATNGGANGYAKSNVSGLGESEYALQFESLLRPHMNMAFRLAYRFSGNVDDAEDLLQDLMIKLYARRIDLTEIEQLQPWLAKTMYRLYVDTIRKKKRSPLSYVDEDDVCMQKADDEFTPLSQIQRSQLQAMLEKGLARLSDEHRELIILCDMEGFSMPEVQQILDIPDGTIKSRLHRARSKLREFIQIS